MFSFTHKKAKAEPVISPDITENPIRDTKLIAVITAALSRYLEDECNVRNNHGFVVRRIRRI
ncbi:MAG TPA: hypothetical protein PK567_05030 [Bacillota bacterium]|mgnify:CR=1 FL=1|nr:hypothetical protein [Bacillota bacterium]